MNCFRTLFCVVCVCSSALSINLSDVFEGEWLLTRHSVRFEDNSFDWDRIFHVWQLSRDESSLSDDSEHHVLHGKWVANETVMNRNTTIDEKYFAISIDKMSGMSGMFEIGSVDNGYDLSKLLDFSFSPLSVTNVDIWISMGTLNFDVLCVLQSLLDMCEITENEMQAKKTRTRNYMLILDTKQKVFQLSMHTTDHASNTQEIELFSGVNINPLTEDVPWYKKYLPWILMVIFGLNLLSKGYGLTKKNKPSPAITSKSKKKKK